MSVARSVAAAIVSLFFLIALLALFGASPSRAIGAMINGSIASPFSVGETLLRMTPLLLTALSVVLAFRAGAWNIGGEGQFIVGAIAAHVATQCLPPGFASLFAGLVAAALAGGMWAGIAALLRVKRNAPEVLSTILLNFIAIHLLGFVVNGPLQESTKKYPQSEAVPGAAELTTIGAGRLHTGLFIALALAAIVWWFLMRTRRGLHLRAVGSNAAAARFAGVRVERELVRALLLSGAIAGIAGGIELLGVTHRLYERFAAGYGYSGITVALLAQLHPLGCVLSAFFIGALRAGAGELQRAEGIASSAALIGEALVILALLIFSSHRFRLRRRRAS